MPVGNPLPKPVGPENVRVYDSGRTSRDATEFEGVARWWYFAVGCAIGALTGWYAGRWLAGVL